MAQSAESTHCRLFAAVVAVAVAFKDDGVSIGVTGDATAAAAVTMLTMRGRQRRSVMVVVREIECEAGAIFGFLCMVRCWIGLDCLNLLRLTATCRPTGLCLASGESEGVGTTDANLQSFLFSACCRQV